MTISSDRCYAHTMIPSNPNNRGSFHVPVEKESGHKPFQPTEKEAFPPWEDKVPTGQPVIHTPMKDMSYPKTGKY